MTTKAADTPLGAATKAVAGLKVTPARPALAEQNGVAEADKTPTRCAHCEEAGRARDARCAGAHCAKGSRHYCQYSRVEQACMHCDHLT